MRQFLSRVIKENGLWKTQYSNRKKTPAHNSVFAKGGDEYIKPLPDSFSRSCFSYCFFLNLDNLKKHLLQLVEIELAVKFSPPFANTFSVVRNIRSAVSKRNFGLKNQNFDLNLNF